MDNALLVGMTPDEFWFGDPELFYNYSRVYEQKFKLEQQNIWQIGARMCQALGSTVIFPAGVVDAKSIKQMPPYPECPYDDSADRELTEEEINYYQEKARINFTNWVNSFKRN